MTGTSASKASIRAFVSVHAGAAPTSAIEYVIKAAEMLPLVCPFCEATGTSAAGLRDGRRARRSPKTDGTREGVPSGAPSFPKRL